MLHLLRPHPPPLSAPDQPLGAFQLRPRGPLSHGSGKMCLEGGCLGVHSLVTSFPACPRLDVLLSSRGIPERVAGAILSITSGRRTCRCIIYASESTGLRSGLPGHGLPSTRPWQVQSTSQEPQPLPSGPDHPCAVPPAPKLRGGSRNTRNTTVS